MGEFKRFAIRAAGAAARYRYPLLALWWFPWFLLATRRPGGLSDWLYFEFGARTLIHYNSHYGGGALSLYANHPVIQIGPPPLLVVAAVQWLPHDPSSLGLAALMAAVGLWALRVRRDHGARAGAGGSRAHGCPAAAVGGRARA